MALIWPAQLLRDPDYFVTDFSEYTAAAQPSGWTSRYGAGATMLVQSVAGSLSGKAARFTRTSAVRTGFSWDKVPLSADLEILIRGRMIEAAGTAEALTRVFGRGSGAAGSENHYTATALYHTSSSSLWRGAQHKLVAGTSTAISTQPDAQAPNFTTNAWYWLRFRLSGTALMHRQWLDGQSEPGSWLTSITDSSLTAAGWVGLLTVEANPDCEVDFFSVALKGKTAPSVRR